MLSNSNKDEFIKNEGTKIIKKHSEKTMQTLEILL